MIVGIGDPRREILQGLVGESALENGRIVPMIGNAQFGDRAADHVQRRCDILRSGSPNAHRPIIPERRREVEG